MIVIHVHVYLVPIIKVEHVNGIFNSIVLTDMMDEISISSRSSSIDDFDFDL